MLAAWNIVDRGMSVRQAIAEVKAQGGGVEGFDEEPPGTLEDLWEQLR